MADFRKWLYAFVAVALLAGISVPASAQSFVQCSPNPNNPLIRAEGYTELAGDLFITCTGGTPTASGSLVPKVTITVFVSTPITSKLTDTSQNPAFNEALLIMDEAGTVGSSFPILNCGSPTAPYGTTPFTCDTVSNGTAAQTYNGSAGHPNVFQARQVNNSGGQAIQFIGVPIDPPGVNASRTVRVTNIRVNAVSQNVTLSQGFSLVTVNATVAFNGTNFGGNQILNVPIATIRPGLVVTTGTFSGDNIPFLPNSETSVPAATFLQCNASAGYTANSLLLTEGFPSAFKVRNWAQIQTNGVPPTISGGDWTWNTTTATISSVDLNQNVPNALYNTESGLEFPGSPCVGQANPVPNPPTGASSGVAPVGQPFSNSNGICQAGSASQGTRFAIQISNIPAGSNPSVPLQVDLHSGTGDNDTGVAVLVCGTDANGAGGTPGSCAGNGIGGTSLVPANGVLVYEVAFDNPNALESVEIPFYVNPTVGLNANPPIGGTPQVGLTATAQASFAPYYPASAQGYAPVGAAQPLSSTLNASGAPIPRFRQDFQPTPPLQLFTYSKCACDMLFPWVVADATYTTSIIVANTSLDPCGGTPCNSGFSALPQSGNVTFWFFGTTDITFDSSNGASATPPGATPANVIGCQTTAAAPAPCAPTANTTAHPVAPGSYVAFVISPSSAIGGGQTAKNNLGPIVDGATGKVATNFAGYVIAQSEFQYCHGVANISASGLSNTYVGLILDKAGANGLPGVQLRRTVQQFADNLDQ